MIVWNGFEIITLVICVIAIIIMVIATFIKEIINKLFKKNCFKCEFYNLNSVTSSGGSTYVCNKTKKESRHNNNIKENYERCKLFERR